ncbi:hypothetical protein J14TS5_40350 [Paenibacillus lautus]|nr:hypothetical protein J14TS5_40350 [Paenibacillus lautus]
MVLVRLAHVHNPPDIQYFSRVFVSKGLRYKSIASNLYLSDGTVRNYASSAYMKLGVRNREEAVQKAREAGLLE